MVNLRLQSIMGSIGVDPGGTGVQWTNNALVTGMR